ncbi:hypothetical protein [Saccharothrix coeruleofusca]|uniref:Uncharacterized protein n=1 Tax=Saccharothrix coeruleofusca TaxID=33919 RepID=A0A918ECT8_9PSEU|nr:hypothetical protein [Saccharothrix coeruleofusca]GGP52575.1 hypothetical protein GCM10010185_25860 [Saccharothrix coeruleofusca]
MDKLAELEPLWDEAGFADFLKGLSEDDAPRLFAIAHEYGTRHDGWIAAWGMAFRDRAEVVSTEGDFRTSTQSPDSALAMFARMAGGEDVKLHLLWLTPPRS